MLNYEDFKKVVVERFMEFMPEKHQNLVLRISPVHKNNRKLDALSLTQKEPGNFSSPIIYVNKMYEQYVHTGDLMQTLHSAADAMEDAFADTPETTDIVSALKKGTIVFQMCNTEMNQERLANMPHREFLDLSIIYCVIVWMDKTSQGGFVVTNDIQKMLGMTEEELYALALANTREILCPKIKKMDEMLQEMGCEELFPDDIPLYVFTNKLGQYGAASILYEDMLQELAEKLDSDLFIFPSSIHECIIKPVEERDNKIKELKYLTKYVNFQKVDVEERLSNQVYYYDRKARTIRQKTNIPGSLI